jgi:quinol monooxygenase YgiN
MYVRLVRFGFGPGKQDAARKLADDLVPAIGARTGCKGVTFFGDHSDGEYGLYVLWDSKENADAAAAVIGPRLQQHLAGNVQSPADRRLFEVFQTSP